ncbi:MAG: FtsX-like permease family protein [Deltaproteobacteria bacterium]|nr:MAG: FtsX-like permease family protein [Deltaproteobacteria bacterium]
MHRVKILEYALAALLRRPGKSAAILTAYTLLVTVLCSVLLLTHALKTEAEQLLAEGPELVVQQTLAGRHDLIPERTAATIAAIPGVASVTPRIWGYYYDSLTKANYTLLAADPAASPLELVAGRLPENEGECAVGMGVAAARRIGVNDDLILIDAANVGTIFTVTGVFKAESRLFTEDLVVVPGEALRRFFAIPAGMATDLAVRVHNPGEIETIAAKVKRQLPATRPITRNDLLRTYRAVFDWRGGMMLALFASALLAFCILAWDKATGLNAGERREIGILKAVGWDTGDVLMLKFWEGLALSLLAFLLGYTLAFAMVFHWGVPVLGDVLRGWSVIFPDLHPVPHVDLYQMATLAFLTIVPFVASTVIPAWRAATSDPDEVMRQ